MIAQFHWPDICSSSEGMMWLESRILSINAELADIPAECNNSWLQRALCTRVVKPERKMYG